MGINRNPEFLDEENETAAYRAIARFALFWGPVELMVESFLILLRNRQGVAATFPVSFMNKVEQLKDHLKAPPGTEAARDRLRPVLARAKELQLLDGRLMFTRSEQKRGVAGAFHQYKIGEIESATVELFNLHDQLSAEFDALKSL